MNEEGQNQTSKFSSGINIIMRLDALWKDTNNHSRAGMYSNWNMDLDRIWCELARDLKDDDYNDKKNEDGVVTQKGYHTRFQEFDEELRKLGGFNDNASQSFEELTKEHKQNREKQYKILMEKELFLRRLENKLGKGTTFEDEDEFSLE